MAAFSCFSCNAVFKDLCDVQQDVEIGATIYKHGRRFLVVRFAMMIEVNRDGVAIDLNFAVSLQGF